MVRGGPEVRFHESSTRVPPGFHQGSNRVPRGFARVAGWCELQKEHRMLLGISPELIIIFSESSRRCKTWGCAMSRFRISVANPRTDDTAWGSLGVVTGDQQEGGGVS